MLALFHEICHIDYRKDLALPQHLCRCVWTDSAARLCRRECPALSLKRTGLTPVKAQLR